MKNLKQMIKTLSRSSNNQGYSLVELLIAGSLTTFIVGISGFGLQAALQSHQKSQTDSTVFAQVNKTLLLIGDEIRSAIRVESDVADAVENEAPSLSLPSDAIPVLAIQIPGVAERIVYYVAESETNSNEVSTTLYRWGPSFDEDGDYQNVGTPTSWEPAQVTNLIDSNRIATPTCESADWAANPPSNAKGFYSCVNIATQRLVQLNIVSSVEPPVSKPVVKSYNTTVYALAQMQEGISRSFPDYQVLGKTLELNQPAKVTFKVLGGEITCGAQGARIPVTTNLYLNNNTTPESWNTSQPLTLPSLAPGTTVSVESIARLQSCNNHNQTVSSKNSNSPLLSVLRNGDSVPNITPFANQSSIDTFLREYIENGKIKLEPNQVIYLFELGTTNTNSSAFDLQDNVVLATIDAP